MDEFLIVDINEMPVAHVRHAGDKWLASAEKAGACMSAHASAENALAWCLDVLADTPHLGVRAAGSEDRVSVDRARARLVAAQILAEF